MKKIIFIVTHKKCGSSKNRALQIHQHLKTFFNTEVRIFKEMISYEFKSTDIIVWIKCLPTKKYKNGYHILDIVDNFNCLRHNLSFFQAIIYPNPKCLEDWGHKFKSKSICIPHFWDPDFGILNTVQNEINMIYVGVATQYPSFLKNDKRIFTIMDTGAVENPYSSVPKLIHKFNVHISIRNPKSINFHYKPNSKISFCASTHSVIITMKEPNIMQFKCMENYPYFMDDYSLISFNKCVELIKKTYMKSVWFNALKIMEQIRELTCLEKIGEQYRELFH